MHIEGQKHAKETFPSIPTTAKRFWKQNAFRENWQSTLLEQQKAIGGEKCFAVI